jgi:PhnB protein
VKTHELFAYLHVKDADKAIEFYKNAFGVTEKFRLTEPSGRIGHAELDFDGATLMISEEYPEYGIRGPQSLGGSAVTIHLHVDDADAAISNAVKAGARIEIDIADHFYGERSGCIRDPFGHRWNIGHSIEAVSEDEMQRRYTEVMKNPPNIVVHGEG